MRENDIPFHVIWTVTKENYESIREIAELCRNMGSKSLTANDMIPMGKAESRNDLLLSSQEIMRLCEAAYEVYRSIDTSDFKIWTSYPFSFLVDPSYLVPKIL